MDLANHLQATARAKLLFFTSHWLVVFCVAFLCFSPVTVWGQTVVIGAIELVGNKKTKDKIVMRELTFSVGDTMSKEAFNERLISSKQNLQNTFLFTSVDLIHRAVADSLLHVTVSMTERWYLWPVPVFQIEDQSFSQWLESRDFSHTTYGGFITQNNFRGRNERISLLALTGFDKRMSVQYKLPYITRKLEEGLSASFSYTSNQQLAVETVSNRLRFLKTDSKILREEYSTALNYTLRKGFYETYTVGLGFRFNSIADTVAATNPDFFLNGETSQRYISIGWGYAYDKRDNKAYPLSGYALALEVNKAGIGVLANETDFLSVGGSYRHYTPLTQKWYLAWMVRGRAQSVRQQPYFNQLSLGGSNNLVRGFDNDIIEGQRFALFRSNLKFNLMPEKTVHIGFIKNESINTFTNALYLNLFADAGYMHDQYYHISNTKVNSLLAGTGFGLDYVTYYSIVLRLEYAVTRFGDQGFFINFTAPI